MVANLERRTLLLDAALELLGREGARAVTHRAIDAAADLPPGTCSNYYPNRATLLLGMAERIYQRLTPSPSRVDELAALTTNEAAPEYVGHVVERLLANPNLARALIELRLEASRNTAVAGALAEFLRQGLQSDVAFHLERGLPGGRSRVVQLHHVANGIVLDAVTLPIDPSSNPVEQARTLARHLYASPPTGI